MDDLLPEALERRPGLQVRVHQLRPRGRRARRDRPVRERTIDEEARLLEEREHVAAGAHGVQVCEQPRGHRAAQRDARTTLVAQRKQPLAEPRGHEIQRVVRCVRDPRALDVHVEVLHVHEFRPAPVCASGDGSRERLLSGLGADRHDLPGLDVGAEGNDQIGEALKDSVLHDDAVLYRPAQSDRAVPHPALRSEPRKTSQKAHLLHADRPNRSNDSLVSAKSLPGFGRFPPV